MIWVMLFSCGLAYLLIVVFIYNFYQCYFIFFMGFLLCGVSVRVLFVGGCFSLNSLFFYLDGLRVILFVLSYLVILMVYLCYYSCKDFFIYFILNFMFVSLSLCFFSSNLFYLYVFFEFSLMPLFLIIVLKGSSLERFQACAYLLIYTFVSSFIFLLLMSFIKNYSIFYLEIKLSSFIREKGVLWIIIFFIFLVKLPVYTAHRWLRKAHVEAPVGGSIVLAGVLLKLGGFGLYRIFRYIRLTRVISLINFIAIFSIIGAIYSCLICLRQVDIKLLIAYSSVRHIGILLRGVLTFTKIGFSGAVGIIIAHGFCSRALFYMANMFYVRAGSRNMLVIKGLVQYFPALCIFWMLFCLCNMGTPPSFNFLCEILLLMVIFKKSLVLLVICLFYLVLVVYYNLVLFLRVGHGQSWHFNFMIKESFSEMLVVFFHLILIFSYLLKTNLYFLF